MTPHYTNTNNPVDFPKSENNMNKRIREFAEQAEFSENDLHIQGDNFQYFAELIVRECSQISRDHQRNYYESHGDRFAKKIKEHFGVEE